MDCKPGSQMWGKGYGIEVLAITSGCYQWKVSLVHSGGGKGYSIGALAITPGCYQWKVSPGLEVLKLFSTQLNMNFQLLIKTIVLKKSSNYAPS